MAKYLAVSCLLSLMLRAQAFLHGPLTGRAIISRSKVKRASRGTESSFAKERGKGKGMIYVQSRHRAGYEQQKKHQPVASPRVTVIVKERSCRFSMRSKVRVTWSPTLYFASSDRISP